MEPNENKVNETLESLNGMGRASANPYLYGKVMTRMQTAGRAMYARPTVIRLAIAVMAIIIGVNVFSLMHYEKKSATTVSTGNSFPNGSLRDGQSSQANAFSEEYFSYLNNMNF